MTWLARELLAGILDPGGVRSRHKKLDKEYEERKYQGEKTIETDRENQEKDIASFQTKKAKGLSFSGLGTDKIVTDNIHDYYQRNIDHNIGQLDQLDQDYKDQSSLTADFLTTIKPLANYAINLLGSKMYDKALNSSTSATLYNSNISKNDNDDGLINFSDSKKKTITGGV